MNGSGRSRRWRWAAVAALPLLCGAYFNSCGKMTVGLWPNYAWVPLMDGQQGAARETQALGLIDGSHVNSVVLFVPWTTDFFGFHYGTFYDANCTLQTSRVKSYVRDFLQKWNAQAIYGGKELNLHLVLPIHVYEGPAAARVGPECKGKQTLLALRDDFETFLDAVLDVVDEPQFLGMNRVISIGNEVDQYLTRSSCTQGPPVDCQTCISGATSANPTDCVSCGSFSDMGTFVTQIRDFINRRYGTPGVTGTSTTFMGLWNEASGGWNTCTKDDAVNLFTKGSAIFLTYYPLQAGTFQPLPPSRVSTHLAKMSELSQAVQAAGGPYTVILQEVGYPTGYSPASSPLFGSGSASGYTNGISAQADFVDDFFAALDQNRSRIRAASWWSLFDFETNLDCTAWDRLGAPGKEAFCTMGLRKVSGDEKCVSGASSCSDSSWDRYVAGATQAESWDWPLP